MLPVGASINDYLPVCSPVLPAAHWLSFCLQLASCISKPTNVACPADIRMVAFHHSHTLQLVPSLLLGLVLSTLLALPLRALAHLRCYYAAVGAPTGSKKVKARRGAKKDDDIDLGGAEALVMAPLSIQ